MISRVISLVICVVFFAFTMTFDIQAQESLQNVSSEIDIKHSPTPTQNLPANLSANDLNRTMTRAHAAIQKKDWVQAEKALSEALGIKADFSVAKELLTFVQKQSQAVTFGKLTGQIRDYLHAEQWQEAIDAGENLPTPPSDLLEGITRAKELVSLENKLNFYLREPLRFTRRSLQAEIEYISEANTSMNLGKRIGTTHQEFLVTKDKWLTSIDVNIVSDGSTEVSIRPGRTLGKFKSQTIRVKPGNYEISGVRRGFREVRESIKVRPGDATHELAIIAKERF